MDTLQKAYSILSATEVELRKLIEVAAKEGQYADVSKLAEIAAQFEPLVNRKEKKTTLGSRYLKLERQPNEVGETATNQATRQKKSGEFPKFEIERDRLVKIGWSKKDRSAYEHRAERGIVLAISLYLASMTDQNIFKMDDLIPIQLNDGSDVPSYQAYLVLAWLRSLGLILKQGKDGYQWSVGEFDESAFNAAWESTTKRT